MEVAPPSPSPFGRVLKDHNLRPSATSSAAQKTLQELVRESLRSSISNSVKSNKQVNPSSVSCLVRKWGGFEAIGIDPNQERVDPGLVRVNSMESENDSVSDWESDRAPVNENGIREKIRVVDIMKKLPLKVPIKQMEGKEMYSPRIRGRQAIADLFARLANDRYKEVEAIGKCRAVSVFPRRGHIHSNLKYKLGRGEADYQAPKGHQELRKSIQLRLASVNSLRRRFSRGLFAENDSKEIATYTLNQPSAEDEEEEETNTSFQEEINLGQIKDEIPQLNHQEENFIEDVTNQEDSTARSESNSRQQTEEKEIFDTPRSSSSTGMAEDPQQEIPAFNALWQESGSDEEAVIDYGSPNGVWDEEYEEEMAQNEYYDNDDFFESRLDWINDIARPHSFWESRRQARYQEICESSRTNNEIRQLIERGSVQAVLASDFRDRMDHLMISNVQLQSHPVDSHEDEERTRVAFLQNQMRSLSGSLQEEEEQFRGHENPHEQEEAFRVEENLDKELEYNHDHENQHEQEEAIRVEENGDMEGEEDTPVMELPWSSYQEEEDRDDLEQIELQTHHQELFVASSYDHDSQVGSSIKNGSNTIEMELISDIRAHMQQIYSEMTELRKTVNNCMDMQSTFQSSIREEVSAVISHLKGKEAKRKAPKKGSCRVCHKKKADSLLYRCGHMCTCFECAHELQWSSGKCPICWAEIVDVVRVCTDYY